MTCTRNEKTLECLGYRHFGGNEYKNDSPSDATLRACHTLSARHCSKINLIHLWVSRSARHHAATGACSERSGRHGRVRECVCQVYKLVLAAVEKFSYDATVTNIAIFMNG